MIIAILSLAIETIGNYPPSKTKDCTACPTKEKSHVIEVQLNMNQVSSRG
jgi:hypothetical protein